LFTENESNLQRLWGVPNRSPYVKDSINDAITQNRVELVNSEKVGTKAAAHYQFIIPAGEKVSIRLRLTRTGGSVEGGAPATQGSQKLAPPVWPAKSENHSLPAGSVVSLSQTHSSALTGASRPSLSKGETERVGVRA